MPQTELTDKFCQSAKVTTGRKVDHFDTTVRGLCLRVTSGGSRSFFQVFTRPADGKRAWVKLGEYPDLSLAKARQKARDARGAVAEGMDPAAEKKAAAAGPTVSDLVENYISRRAVTRRSADEIARILRKDVAGVIGEIKLSALHRRDLTKCIDRVHDRGSPVAAARLFANLRAMVRWARGRGDLDTNLTEGMQRPSEATERDRVLTPDEIRVMWRELADADMRESTRRILRLCLVTAQRVGEVAGMTRAELDLKNAVWTIPAARSKNKREHTVPLSDMAIWIIRQQIADADKLAKRKERKAPTWVFPGPGARAPVTSAAVSKAVLREEWSIDHWTPHDLRRTAATEMEKMGVSPFVIGHVLNHATVVKSSVTSRHYAHYDYANEKRDALKAWAAYLAKLAPLRIA